MLVINGASTDNTEDVCLAQTDPRFDYQRCPFNWLGDKVNIGFHQAKGDYLAWLCSDDWYAPTFLQDMINALSDGKHHFAYSDFVFEQRGQFGGNARAFEGYKSLLRNNKVGIFWLITKKLFLDVGDMWNGTSEDYDYALRSAEKGYELLFVDKILGVSGEHPDRFSHHNDIDKATQIVKERSIERQKGIVKA